MIDLIIYFVFSAIFSVGVLAWEHQDNIPLDEFIMAIILGWLLLPFRLGMLVVKCLNDDERTDRTV